MQMNSSVQHHMTSWQQHMTTTWQQHKSVQTLLGIENSTKGKKVETTIHYAKQPQLSVRVSLIRSLNEEIEIKLSSLSVCCSSFQSLAAWMCVLWGSLTECDWVFGMWRMRAAVDISDRGSEA